MAEALGEIKILIVDTIENYYLPRPCTRLFMAMRNNHGSFFMLMWVYGGKDSGLGSDCRCSECQSADMGNGSPNVSYFICMRIFITTLSTTYLLPIGFYNPELKFHSSGFTYVVYYPNYRSALKTGQYSLQAEPWLP